MELLGQLEYWTQCKNPKRMTTVTTEFKKFFKGKKTHSRKNRTCWFWIHMIETLCLTCHNKLKMSTLDTTQSPCMNEWTHRSLTHCLLCWKLKCRKNQNHIRVHSTGSYLLLRYEPFVSGSKHRCVCMRHTHQKKSFSNYVIGKGFGVWVNFAWNLKPFPYEGLVMKHT